MLRVIFLLVCSVSLAQQTPQNAAEKLYDAIYNIDIDTVLELSCLENDADTYARLDRIFQSDLLKIRFSLTQQGFEISQPKEIDGRKWSLVSFRNVVRVTYFNKLTPEEISDNEERLRKNYKPASIRYENHRNSFLIVYPAKFLTYHDGTSWKAVVADDTFIDGMFKTCIPEGVRKEFGL